MDHLSRQLDYKDEKSGLSDNEHQSPTLSDEISGVFSQGLTSYTSILENTCFMRLLYISKEKKL